MENNLQIDVAALDDQRRRALEDVIGRHLEANQRLVISVMEVEASTSERARPVQSLSDWTMVYEGLSATEIDSINRAATSRANLTRDLP